MGNFSLEYFKAFRGTDIAKLEAEINAYLVTRNLDQSGGIFNSISIKVSEPGEDQITVEVITSLGAIIICPTICITGEIQSGGQSVPCSGDIQVLKNFVNGNPPYSNVLTPSAGTPGFTWSIIAGSLPPGWGLNPGQIQSPIFATPDGIYIFTVQVMDSLDCIGTQQFSIEVLST